VSDLYACAHDSIIDPPNLSDYIFDYLDIGLVHKNRLSTAVMSRKNGTIKYGYCMDIVLLQKNRLSTDVKME
jgi:hypothetical protein